MTAVLLDGKALAGRLLRKLAVEIEGHRGRARRAPRLAIVWVRDEGPLGRQATRKARAGRQAGVDCELHALPEESTNAHVMAKLRAVDLDPEVDGILLQYPLPGGLSYESCGRALSPGKDVDGATPEMRADLQEGDLSAAPATLRGLSRLLEEHGIELTGRDVLVVGPPTSPAACLAPWLRALGASYRQVPSDSESLEDLVRVSRVVLATSSPPARIPGHWLLPRGIALDLAYLGPSGGSFDIDGHDTRISAYLPARGGAGPMTVYEVFRATAARWISTGPGPTFL